MLTDAEFDMLWRTSALLQSKCSNLRDNRSDWFDEDGNLQPYSEEFE